MDLPPRVVEYVHGTHIDDPVKKMSRRNRLLMPPLQRRGLGSCIRLNSVSDAAVVMAGSGHTETNLEAPPSASYCRVPAAPLCGADGAVPPHGTLSTRDGTSMQPHNESRRGLLERGRGATRAMPTCC